MWSLLVHPNHYKKSFTFFLLSIRNETAKPINKRKKSKNVFFLAPSKKYTMIEEFKDELRSLRNILNEIKKPGAIERTRNKWNKKWNKRKIEYSGWWNKQYLRKVGSKFNKFRTKMYILWETAWLKDWKKKLKIIRIDC